MKLRYIAVVFGVVFFISCKEKPKETDEKTDSTTTIVADAIPQSTYEDLEGNAIELSDYKGKRVVVNYWATWCRPCIEEMPAMVKLQEALVDENYVFLFASDQSTKKIIAFKEKRKFDLNFVKFNDAYAGLGITALPVTLIYNEAGEQVERIEGAMIWDSPEMIQKLKQLN